MSPLHDSILDTVGDTPVVRLNRLSPPGRTLWAKLESFNPLGSVKDRLALGVLEDAEARGELSPGQTVVEATSGNTGIGLAMACAAKGHPFVAVMAENFSLERRRILRFLGARVVLTPAPQRGTAMRAKAAELAEEHGWYWPRQFENEANADYHSKTTAREIVEDFEGVQLDAFVTGFGTGGTLKGIARVLKRELPDTRIVAAEPDNSRLLASGIAQERHPDGSPAASHPSFRTHPIQGWGADFVPQLAEDAIGLVDDFLPVGGADALRLSRELAQREGIFAGISAGATLAAAQEVAASLPEGANVLFMVPDTGERYLTTPLFQDVPVEMTEEETALSRSTPGARFDVPVAAAPAPEVAATPDAAVFVDAAVNDPEQPVVMFALEWCEFCWAVRRLFQARGISYRSIDLDSADFQREDPDATIRAAVAERTGSRTVPQVFVGGELVGGCTETIDAQDSGRLDALLDEAGVRQRESLTVEAASFMPGWLHPR
jgi:cysteine synthase A